MSVLTPARWSRGGAHRHPSCFIACGSVFGWCVHAVVVTRSVCPRRAVLFTCDSFDSDNTCFFSSGVCVFRCGQAARARPSVACAAHNRLHAMPAAEGQGNGCGVTPLRAGDGTERAVHAHKLWRDWASCPRPGPFRAAPCPDLREFAALPATYPVMRPPMAMCSVRGKGRRRQPLRNKTAGNYGAGAPSPLCASWGG